MESVSYQHQCPGREKSGKSHAFFEHDCLDGEIPGCDSHDEIDSRNGIVDWSG